MDLYAQLAEINASIAGGRFRIAMDGQEIAALYHWKDFPWQLCGEVRCIYLGDDPAACIDAIKQHIANTSRKHAA